MTTPQWTVDDGVACWGGKYAGAIPLDNNGDPVTDWSDPDAHAAVAALVADVAAARLVDDMAAVVRRYETGWWSDEKIGTTDLYWFNGFEDPEPMSPCEVAALHHARRQEDREPQPGDGPDYHAEHQSWTDRQRDGGVPIPRDPDRRADLFDRAGLTDEERAAVETVMSHHARQQEET